ncbi:carbohydrate-binding domain-containing protein [Teredinibacter haidensis]|uniref:carbohydrate-binding domain-containing protein n=1 Tax=Teredinibacter haidensis TaxID=2731755 RepID=UPI003CCDF2CC
MGSDTCNSQDGGNTATDTNSGSASGICDWYGTDYPLCTNQSSDWGWENDQSCIGPDSCPGGSGTDSSTSSSSSSSSTNTGSSQQCNWYGTSYPMCQNQSSDWGYENGESCIGVDTCNSQDGGNTTSSSSSSSNTGSTSGSCPSSLSCPSGIECGCYTVSGLGSNKQSYTNAGADRRFLASAMMETEMMDTNYTYGDGKSGDAFNAGATKQNWGMMRQCHSAWSSYGADDYDVSAAMNSSKSLDVQVYNECRSYFGDNWFAGHRNGSSGLDNPNTSDINNFKTGYQWTYDMLNGHESDDIRFWVSIPAI